MTTSSEFEKTAGAVAFIGEALAHQYGGAMYGALAGYLLGQTAWSATLADLFF